MNEIVIKYKYLTDSLTNQWSYEKFGNCLHLLEYFPEYLNVSTCDSKLASIYYNKLTSQPDMSITILNTLLGIQSKNLITKYQNLIHL